MPALTFEVELGTGSPTSNSYASVSEADNFMGSHLSGGLWSTQGTPRKETILIMAARLLDSTVTYKGYKTNFAQVMQWPRAYVEIDLPAGYYIPSTLTPDGNTLQGSLYALGSYIPSNLIPPALKLAQLEVAVLLLTGGDRTADQDADGIASVSLGKGAVAVTFDPNTAKTLLGRIAPNLLAELCISTGSKRGMAIVRRM